MLINQFTHVLLLYRHHCAFQTSAPLNNSAPLATQPDSAVKTAKKSARDASSEESESESEWEKENKVTEDTNAFCIVFCSRIPTGKYTPFCFADEESRRRKTEEMGGRTGGKTRKTTSGSCCRTSGKEQV